MAEKGRIISIGDLRAQRERKRSAPTSPTSSEPTKGRGGLRAAVRDYETALSSGDASLRADAAARIYALRGTRGADTIAGIQTRHKARERSRTKSGLRIVKPEEK